MHIISSLIVNLLAWLNESATPPEGPQPDFNADLPPYHPLRD